MQKLSKAVPFVNRTLKAKMPLFFFKRMIASYRADRASKHGAKPTHDRKEN